MAVVSCMDSGALVSEGRLLQFENEMRGEIYRLENNIVRQVDGIIASYLCSILPKATQEDIKSLELEINNIKNNTSNKPIDMILTEGITDKEYLEIAIGLFSPTLKNKIDNGKLEIYVNDKYGGVKNLTYNLYQRINNKNAFKTLALFDNDFSGQNECDLLRMDGNIIHLENCRQIKILKIKPSETLKLIQKELKNMPDFTIEHLLSIDFWKVLKEKEYIEKANKDFLYKFIPNNVVFDEIDIEKYRLSDVEVNQSYFGLYPKDDCKKDIIRLLKDKTDDEKARIMIGFKDTINDIQKFFVD